MISMTINVRRTLAPGLDGEVAITATKRWLAHATQVADADHRGVAPLVADAARGALAQRRDLDVAGPAAGLRL